MSNLGILLGVLLVFAPRNAVSNMMTFYSEENAFMKLVENTKHGFTYWNQKCSDLGDGWRLAVISSQTKYELIEQKHGALSDDSSCWVGGSTDTEDEKFVPFFRYVSNSTGQRHVLISTYNCGVYGTSNFQLISNVGSTLLHGALCETHGLSYKSDTSLYQKLVSSTSHNFSYWERKCSEIGDGWAPAVINSQTEHDFIKTEQRTLSNNNNCWIGGSTNSIPGTNFDYGHRYDPQPDSPVRVFVSTHVVSGRNSNGVFQLRAESSSFLLPGVLCEKQVGGNDGGGNDTGSNNGGGNNLP